MKGYCGHITHLSVVSDFEILIFCLFIYFLVCLYLVLCWFCKRKMVQSFWRKITFCIFVKKIHCQHQQGLGSQKYFWCLDLEIFKFISQTIFTKLCMLFLIVCKKKCLPLWTLNKAPTDNELSLQPSVSRKQKTFLKLSMGPNPWKW